MKKITLANAAVVLLIIAVVAFLIAGIIGVEAGIFRAFASGIVPPGEHGPGKAVNEHYALPLAKTSRIVIKSDSEEVELRDSPDNSIRAWFHGVISTSSPGNFPHLLMVKKGNQVEIRIQRKQYPPISWSREINTSFAVAIPRTYAGDLSIQSCLGKHLAGKAPLCHGKSLPPLPGKLTCITWAWMTAP